MANYVNLSKKTFNPYNPKVLNEGQFSWMTSDTDQQIGSEKQNTIDVWMYDNEGNSWYENRYDGYGIFGGMDYYELLAKMNGYTDEDLKPMKARELRQIGIDLAFKKLKTKDKGKKVLFPALVANGKYNWKRHDFTQEAESDPNQSWYQEPEYDDYEDDYYESEQVTEGEVLLFDELNDKFDVLATSISELMDKTEDPKWTKALGGLMKQLEKLISTAANHDTKLGAIETNESVVLDESQIKVKSWFGQRKEFRDWLKKHKVDVLSAEGEDGKDVIELVLTGKTKDLKKILKSDHKFGWDDKQMWDYIEEGTILTEARDWGTFGTPEAKTVIKDLDKALQKFTSALAKAHNDYMKAVTQYTDGPKSDIGNKSGFNDTEGRVAVSIYTQGAIKQALNMHEWGGGLEYKVGWMYESKDWTRLMEDLGINEGRSINKISKDHAATVLDMSKTVGEWKSAEGDRKTELLELLRELNKRKANLEKELDAAVAGKDKNVQLALEEAEVLAHLELDLVKIFEQDAK